MREGLRTKLVRKRRICRVVELIGLCLAAAGLWLEVRAGGAAPVDWGKLCLVGIWCFCYGYSRSVRLQRLLDGSADQQRAYQVAHEDEREQLLEQLAQSAAYQTLSVVIMALSVAALFWRQDGVSMALLALAVLGEGVHYGALRWYRSRL